jgi:hypothetical protein
MAVRAEIGTLTSSSVSPIEGVVDIGRMIDPEPLVRTGRNWTRWAGPIVSVFILAAVAYQLRKFDFTHFVTPLPVSLGFWLAFVVYYLASPASEWIIFRRLWTLPVEGFFALLRKLVSNTILLGYLGEVYFYAWARRNAQVSAAPFGAIKDVSILSALTGNLVTLAMVVISVPLFRSLKLGLDGKAFVLSTVFVTFVSLAALLLRKRLFTLPRRELWIISGIHFGRIVATILLAAVMWHILLPTVAISWWLLLGTLRQLVSRLPFLPNKDVVFAGLAVFFVGNDANIASAMALMAALILAANLLVGALLGVSELVRESHAR